MILPTWGQVPLGKKDCLVLSFRRYILPNGTCPHVGIDGNHIFLGRDVRQVFLHDGDEQG